MGSAPQKARRARGGPEAEFTSGTASRERSEAVEGALTRGLGWAQMEMMDRGRKASFASRQPSSGAQNSAGDSEGVARLGFNSSRFRDSAQRVSNVRTWMASMRSLPTLRSLTTTT